MSVQLLSDHTPKNNDVSACLYTVRQAKAAESTPATLPRPGVAPVKAKLAGQPLLDQQ